ncbi:hypothetical protein DO021_21555 [Desulfobacter hydrogenophilus]|uniref:Uncharacterized protein n=1 Tax=Desulfobacter hydrogenophilus TaxID=2291 RepID=A0A328F625_9BACT|nr:hypothetical protein [Desulfobacter hydrogenophilus]NDY74456.1 hypothetical protein [Desulfobacter hydrogenophilus]QBH14294.1 hypothetical protein EYB58_16050 [Desulfobacter hydrogenophilus]RAL99983.1 hypothetical protein DO021_21555 [Desulfobacter hydrogenophilus]
MSKRTSKNEQQMEFDWDFPSKLEKVVRERRQIQKNVAAGPAKKVQTENEFDLCILLSAGVKKAITESGLSRDHVVDGINVYFGRNHDDADKNEGICRKPITIHMLNNYLSKPAEYPVPAYYLFALHHVTHSLEPARVLVEAEGAKIATGADIRQMALGKLEEHIVEINRLKKEIKCQR